MFLTTLLLVVGLIAGVLAVQLGSFRMSGVLTVPLLAVYGLYNYATVPVFVLSALAAYVVLTYVKSRTFLYGRRLLLLAVITGALVPITTLAILDHWSAATFISEVEFIGSILPGIAAYNLHQLDTDRRVNDAILSLGVLIGLILLGVALLEPFAPLQAETAWPPILHSAESDVAAVQDLTLDTEGYRSVVSLPVGGGIILLGLAFAELARDRWGLRADGIIAVPLLAIFSLQTADALVLYLLLVPLTYIAIDRLEAQTGFYGRISLAFAIACGVLIGLPLVPVVGIQIGLIAFFCGIFAGITVYNLRRIPTVDRFHSLLITAGLYTAALSLIRIVTTPASGGLLPTVHSVHIAGAVVAVIIAVWVCYRKEERRPAITQTSVQE